MVEQQSAQRGAAAPALIRHVRSDPLARQVHRVRALMEAGDAAAAAKQLQSLLREHPDHLHLHRLLHQAAVAARSAQWLERSLVDIARLDTSDGKSLEQLADLYRASGRLEEAIVDYRRAIERDRSLLGAYQNLSGCLIEAGRWSEAITVCEQGLQRFKRLPELHYNLGLAHHRLGHHEEAAVAYERAIERNSHYVKARSNLGNTLRILGRLDEGESHLRVAVEEAPVLWAAHVNLGNLLKAQGRLEESCERYKKAAELNPRNPVGWSNLLALLPYLPECDALDQAHIARRFEQTTIAPSPEAIASRPHHWRVRSNRIRIGYISADFRAHVSMCFLEPVLAQHDRSRFEIFCYDNTAVQDAISAQLRGLECSWRSITQMDDEAVVSMIRDDGIDVLVDLMGHTEGHRLGVLASRAAPVQMTWLGFPGSTGLSSVDYWITDRHIAHGMGLHDYRTESFLALPNCERCFRPDPAAPEVSETPSLNTDAFTFGSFNAAYKLNQRVLSLWSELLQRVPQSRLLMVSIPEGKAQQPIRDAFRQHGISEDRIQIVPRIPQQAYLRLHAKIDLMLDPFPYNGVTTTLQSLWMGVPVLTLKGARYPTRVGASILANMGLHSFIAHDASEYVSKAAWFADHRAHLQALRCGMRERMLASPVLDEQGFTRDLEALTCRRVPRHEARRCEILHCLRMPDG